jgi:hypothetical protein
VLLDDDGANLDANQEDLFILFPRQAAQADLHPK